MHQPIVNDKSAFRLSKNMKKNEALEPHTHNDVPCHLKGMSYDSCFGTSNKRITIYTEVQYIKRA